MEKTILELRNALDKSTVEDAERMLRSFFRTIEPHGRRNKADPERISWEIYAEKDKISFYIVVPKRLKSLIRSRIIDAYPQVDISETEVDHAQKFEKPFTAKMELRKHHMFATKMNADDTPLNSILNSMSRLGEDERMMLQISILPINDKWQGKVYKKYRDMLFHGIKPKKFDSKRLILKGIAYGVKGLLKPLDWIVSGVMGIEDTDKSKNTPIERAELKQTQQKIALPGFTASIRMAVESKDRNVMSVRLSELVNSFIETDADNEWRRLDKVNNKKILVEIKERKVERLTNNIVTTSELSPLIRLANRGIIVPELNNKEMKTLPIPTSLDKGVYFAEGLHNSNKHSLFLDPNKVDSFVHPWMITGAMGGGKTTLINNMMLGRALAGYGTIIIDTQGDQSIEFLSQLPQSEWHRVVWLNYGDLSYPVALDMMETIPIADPDHEKFVTDFAKDELVGIFKRMFGQNFGPQTEYIVRHIITATMECGVSSFIDMFRMLIDDNFREEVAAKIKYKAPFCWSFWRNFQDNFTLPQKMRMMMPSINKIGSFVDKRAVRNITSQGLGSQKYSFRKMMDEGNIVVVTIPKGKLIGVWQLIAKLVLSKVWLATLSREDIPKEERRPAFVAMDEALDLVQDSDNLEIMNSQARKFRLGIIYGFQYLDQIKTADRKVYNSIIGNKPNIVALKIGEKDAEVYEEIFKGYYSKEEMSFPNLHGIAKLLVGDDYTTPFTVKIPYNFHTKDDTPREKIGDIDFLRDDSRMRFAQPLDVVERIVDEKYSQVLQNMELDENEVANEAMMGDIDMDEEAFRKLMGSAPFN